MVGVTLLEMRPLLIVPVILMLAACSSSSDPNAKFLADAAKKPGAVTTGSGLVYRDITVGTGPSPTINDTVKVNYIGKLTDGTEFDASSKHGGPAEFPLKNVIPCWIEGVQKMKVGGKAELVCPAKIAYGDAGSPPVIPGGATLDFEIELLGIGNS